MFGHLSYYPRHRGSRYLLSPRAGFQKDTCTGEDICELAFDDEWAQGLPLEMYMHSEVHRLHPEVGALVHSHSPALTQLSALAEVPGDALLLHASFWPDEVPVFQRPHLVVERPDAVRLIGQLDPPGDGAVPDGAAGPEGEPLARVEEGSGVVVGHRDRHRGVVPGAEGP
ncbi:MAG TPA: class II aldolase/adducin family protein, partial [Trebonia sp.]